MEDDDTSRLVEGSGELLVPNHLGDNRGDLAEGEGEGSGEEGKRQGTVMRSVGEKVCSETLFLDAP